MQTPYSVNYSKFLGVITVLLSDRIYTYVITKQVSKYFLESNIYYMCDKNPIVFITNAVFQTWLQPGNGAMNMGKKIVADMVKKKY